MTWPIFTWKLNNIIWPVLGGACNSFWVVTVLSWFVFVIYIYITFLKTVSLAIFVSIWKSFCTPMHVSFLNTPNKCKCCRDISGNIITIITIISYESLILKPLYHLHESLYLEICSYILPDYCCDRHRLLPFLIHQVAGKASICVPLLEPVAMHYVVHGNEDIDGLK